jgi:hypothetical protein
VPCARWSDAALSNVVCSIRALIFTLAPPDSRQGCRCPLLAAAESMNLNARALRHEYWTVCTKPVPRGDFAPNVCATNARWRKCCWAPTVVVVVEWPVHAPRTTCTRYQEREARPIGRSKSVHATPIPHSRGARAHQPSQPLCSSVPPTSLHVSFERVTGGPCTSSSPTSFGAGISGCHSGAPRARVSECPAKHQCETARVWMRGEWIPTASQSPSRESGEAAESWCERECSKACPHPSHCRSWDGIVRATCSPAVDGSHVAYFGAQVVPVRIA